MRRYFIVFIVLLCAQLAAGQDVYKTPSGAKYHLASCRMVENVSQRITLSEAKEMGLGPCAICKPANIYAGTPPAVKKTQGEDKGVQCNGKTKAGLRCKHYTRIGNGYCYQHQP